MAIDGLCALLQIGVGPHALLDATERDATLATLAAHASQASTEFAAALSVDGAPPLDAAALEALRGLLSASDASLVDAASRALRSCVVPRLVARLTQLCDDSATKVVADSDFVSILV